MKKQKKEKDIISEQSFHRNIKPAMVIWEMSTQAPEEEEEEEEEAEAEQGTSPGTRRHHHDMLNRVQALEQEQEDSYGYEQEYPSREEMDDYFKGGVDSLASGRERLKRHRTEVAGRVWIPEIWGQEEFLKDWVDCTVFDSSLVPSKILSARAALVEEARRATSPVLSIGNRC